MGLIPGMKAGVICPCLAIDFLRAWECAEASSSCLEEQALGSGNVESE